MATFTFKAINSNGSHVESQLEAASRLDALSQLQQRGLFALDVKEKRISNGKKVCLKSSSVTRFYLMLADQLEVGVPILKALEVIREQERTAAAKQVLDDIARQVTAGSTLGSALQSNPESFPELDVNVIRAGEEGGFLGEALARVAQVREWQSSLTASVWGTLAYPLILLGVSVLLIPGMLIFLVPKFEPLFESLRSAGKMPWVTTLLLGTASLANNYGLYMLFVLLGGIFLVGWWVPRNTLLERLNWIGTKTPFVGSLSRDLALARFCRVLGTMLQNKIPILKAMDVSSSVVGHRMLRRAIESSKVAVGAGRTLTEPLAKSQQVPPDVLAMLGVGEQSNTLDTVLVKIATQLETRSRKRLEFSVKLLEPAMLLGLALLVGFMVIALLLPVFEGQGLT